ncbi:MAG TPA: hypothetical protein H9671_04810 [Firmicutes bacterium]|nr:hypothetical protein [Bacillota bacterium]
MKRKSIFILGLSCFGNMVVGTFLSSVIVFSLGLFSEHVWLQVIVQTLTLILFSYLPYSQAWKAGDRDNNYVRFDRVPEDLFRGVKAGLVASIPYGCMLVMLIVGKVIGSDLCLLLYKIGNIYLLPILNAIHLEPEIMGLSWGQVAAYGIFSLLPLILVSVGYLLGYKQIMLTEKLVFINQTKNNTKR